MLLNSSIKFNPYRSHWILIFLNVINIIITSAFAIYLALYDSLTIAMGIFAVLLVCLFFVLICYHYVLTKFTVTLTETRIVFENSYLHKTYVKDLSVISNIYLYIPYRGPGVYVLTTSTLPIQSVKKYVRKGWSFATWRLGLLNDDILVFARPSEHGEAIDSVLQRLKKVQKTGYPW